MKIIFTRHGETKENIEGISMGQSVNGVLNEQGLRQAQKLAERFKDVELQYIYTSDLTRAIDTAREVVKNHPQAKLISTPALRERNLGVYEGKSRDLWQENGQDSDYVFQTFKPENGESYLELQTRVKIFFNELLKKHTDENILIVSHSGTLTMLFLYIFNRPITWQEYQKYKPGNTSITICEFDATGKCTLQLLNSTDHI